MNLSDEFEKFCSSIQIGSSEKEKWEKRVQKITKKLNRKYYISESSYDNMTIVGSIGRNTAIRGISDLDCIFELPQGRSEEHTSELQSR